MLVIENLGVFPICSAYEDQTKNSSRTLGPLDFAMYTTNFTCYQKPQGNNL